MDVIRVGAGWGARSATALLAVFGVLVVFSMIVGLSSPLSVSLLVVVAAGSLSLAAILGINIFVKGESPLDNIMSCVKGDAATLRAKVMERKAQTAAFEVRELKKKMKELTDNVAALEAEEKKRKVVVEKLRQKETALQAKASAQPVAIRTVVAKAPVATAAVKAKADAALAKAEAGLIAQRLKQRYPSLHDKDKDRRIELERHAARLVQEESGSFSISQVLTLIIGVYAEADAKREEISVELKRWVEDDSFCKRVSYSEGITRYKLL